MARVNSWANPNEYVEALQAPQRAFSDPALRDAHIVTNRFGLPRPISGNFATVFEVETERGKAAVRCFMREVTNQQERYAAIAAHLRQRTLPFMVNFEYLPEGIRVRGGWYPILKMDWADGIRLDTYIEQHLDDAPRLRRLADQWIAVCSDLRAAQIAHGDLQHGNILVTDADTITLIDYDDMIVPGALGLETRELGHRHYQHPSRAADQRINQDNFTRIDNFSSTVIGVSLLALSLDPSLWAQTGAGDESLLFRDTDYAAPDNSAALHLLTRHADSRLRAIGQTIQTAISASSYLDVPPLARSPLEGTARRAKSWLVERIFTVPSPPPTPDPPATKPDSWVFDYLTAEAEAPTSPDFTDDFLRQERRAIDQAFAESIWRSAYWLAYPYLLIELMRRFPSYPVVRDKRRREAQYHSLEDQVAAALANRKRLSRLIVEADRCYQQEVRVLELRLARLADDLQYARAKEARELVHIERVLNDPSAESALSVDDLRARERQYGESCLQLEQQQRDDQAQLDRVRRNSENLARVKYLRAEFAASERDLAALRREHTQMQTELDRYDRIARRDLLWYALRSLLIGMG